jgi:hypothetical protein
MTTMHDASLFILTISHTAVLPVFRLHHPFSAPHCLFPVPTTCFKSPPPSTGSFLPSLTLFLLPLAVFCFYHPFSASITHFLPLLLIFCLRFPFPSLPTIFQPYLVSPFLSPSPLRFYIAPTACCNLTDPFFSPITLLAAFSVHLANCRLP